MEKSGNISIKDLKNLKINDNLKEDSFFRDIITLCINDKLFLKKSSSAFLYDKNEVIWFSHYKVQFIWLCFMYLYNFVFDWSFLDTSVNFLNVDWNLIPTLFVLVLLFSVIICLLNMIMSWREHGFADVLQIVIIGCSYYLIRYKGLHDYKVFIISLISQIVIEIMISLVCYKKFTKVYHKHNNEIQKLKKEFAGYEDFYNQTMKKGDARIKFCSEALKAKGIDDSKLEERFYWWKSNKCIHPLRSGENFDKLHKGCYEYVKIDKYEYYNRLKNEHVKGETVKTTDKYFHKTYSVVPVNKAENYKVIQNIKINNFAHIYPFIIDESILTEYNIYAVECICKINSNTEVVDKNTVFASPTEDQVAQARKRIDEKYDNRERMQNLIKYDHDYTTKEMMDRYGFDNERYMESVESDYLRKRDTNHYVQSNSTSEKNSHSRNWKNTDTSSCVIMYIIDGCIFYNKNHEKELWPEDNFTYIKTEEDYYETREEEVEALIDYLLRSNSGFAKNIIENTWSGYSNLSAKIMHTVAGDSSILNCFN